MTDSKTRDAFEAWAKPKNLDLRPRESGDYWNTDGNTQSFWLCWQAARRATLEEAALAAERSIGAGACTPLEEYRAGFIADEIRALADETREG